MDSSVWCADLHKEFSGELVTVQTADRCEFNGVCEVRSWGVILGPVPRYFIPNHAIVGIYAEPKRA